MIHYIRRVKEKKPWQAKKHGEGKGQNRQREREREREKRAEQREKEGYGVEKRGCAREGSL